MAVAHDATSGSAALVNTATTTTWTHTPTGTPKGVVVVIPQGTSVDNVSAVTYGGVALTRVRRAARTAAEACAVYTYFLGAGVPTGAQTVAVTTTGTAPCWPQVATVTAAAGKDTAVDVENGLDAGIIANPSLALTPTEQAALYYVCASGLNAPVSTPETGTTLLQVRDLGTISGHMGRKEVAGAGATTIGWTSASDDVCHGGLAIKEVDPPVPLPMPLGSRLLYPGRGPQSPSRFLPAVGSRQIPETSHTVTELAVTFSTWEARELPQYLRPGSLLLAFLASDRNSFTTVSAAPAGWREIPGTVPTQNQLGTADTIGWFYYKLLAEGDPELDDVKPTWTLASTSAGVLVLVRYEGAHPTQPINIARSIGTASATSHVLPTIGPSVDGCRIVSGVAADKTSSTQPFNYWTQPTGWTERLDIEGAGSFEEVAVADLVQQAAAPISATWTSFDTEGAVGFIAALNPTSAVIASDPRSQVGPLLHPGLGPSLARFWQRPVSTEVVTVAAVPAGAADVPQRSTVAATGTKLAAGVAAVPQRGVTQATGTKLAAGAAAVVQRSSTAAAGTKVAAGAAAVQQRSRTAATGVKIGLSASGPAQRSQTSETQTKIGVGVGVGATAQRSTVQAAGAVVAAGPGGAANVAQRSQLAAAGSKIGTGTGAVAQRVAVAAAGAMVAAPAPEPNVFSSQFDQHAGAITSETDAVAGATTQPAVLQGTIS